MVTHRAPGPPRRLLAVLGAALVVLLSVVGIAVAKAHSSGSAATTSASGSTSSPTSGSASPSSTSSSSASSAAPAGSSSASTSGPAPSASAAPVEAWTQCQDQLRSGSDLLGATDKAAGSWKTHYEAQILYDAGKIDLARTRQMWETSKAAGFGEVKAYDASSTRYDKAGKACAALPLVVPSQQKAAAKTCAAKADAQTAAIKSGSAVAGAWAEHMHMMVSTPDHGTPQYLRKWHDMVHTAPAQRAAYDKDLSAYQKLPSCSAPSA